MLSATVTAKSSFLLSSSSSSSLMMTASSSSSSFLFSSHSSHLTKTVMLSCLQQNIQCFAEIKQHHQCCVLLM